MKILEGAIYTVDDVSDLLGIPRPTLYRYLREYHIPHLRQGGRIRIPEDSFDRIREARDLHKEGLGTESVRRQIREGGLDSSELDRRLNSLHETLEDLRGDLKSKPSTGELALSPVLQTILARQSLMLSAMFNLSGMVEDILLANGRSRKRPVQRYEDDPVAIAAEERGQLAGTVVEHVPVREPSPAPSPVPRAGFGSLARRRRRGALAALSVLLLGLFLVIFLPTMNGAGTASKETAPREQPAGDRREPPDERPAAAAGDGDGKPGSDNNAGGGTDDAGDDAGVEAGNVAAATDTTTEQAPDGPGGTPKGDAVTSASGGGVPDVSGRSLEEAAVTLREAGYDVTAIQVRPGSEEPGTVIETEPGPGTDAPSGSPVVLTTSSGPTGTASASASSESVSSASASAATSSSASASASPSP